tara:strand:+ start:4126 stop:4374 length:249 start_codon:yes stop_codon:yes gene_type:complete
MKKVSWKWLSLAPAVAVVFGAAIAWGQLLQQNEDHSRRIQKIEDAVLAVERIDERTVHMLQNIKEQRRLLDGLVRVWGPSSP